MDFKNEFAVVLYQMILDKFVLANRFPTQSTPNQSNRQRKSLWK